MRTLGYGVLGFAYVQLMVGIILFAGWAGNNFPPFLTWVWLQKPYLFASIATGIIAGPIIGAAIWNRWLIDH